MIKNRALDIPCRELSGCKGTDNRTFHKMKCMPNLLKSLKR